MAFFGRFEGNYGWCCALAEFTIAGLNRFEALRAFKKRYGLPPHAYQLCLRISHARRLLLGGASAAEVAARCGFADQSHFTRHFKRFNGVTPAQYAHAHRPSASRSSGTYRTASDPSAIVVRSDR
jgi:AraC-like DNA-binding protein